ncbi:MAG: ATP-binding cassette domain-containing protein [Clostridia bacterium]|nr:ATP-binding cassette domain-containing protein [Clostridia bacterium]
MLELKNISFVRDNKRILDNINLKIYDNKFYAITGPNGSGKSTLAKIIMGIEKPDYGQIIFNGKDITNLSVSDRAKLGLSFAFQQPVKFKGLTVYDILSFANDDALSNKEAYELLEKVGLDGKEYLEREINNSLSGGELKRIEIATVLAKKSELCIFDEPEAGIDLWSFQGLIQVFNEIRENLSMVIISHQERILNIADEIILLKEGKIVDSGNTEKVLDKIYNN